MERILVSCMHDKEATVGRMDRWLVGSMVGWLDRSMFVFLGGVGLGQFYIEAFVFFGGEGRNVWNCLFVCFFCLFVQNTKTTTKRSIIF